MMQHTPQLSGLSSGVPALDRLHHDVFDALETLSLSDEHEFNEGYNSFVKKIERAFRQEEDLMEEVDFPALPAHREQHARVLGALHYVHSQIMSGESGLGREVIDRLLPQWYALHISTMDAVLAIAIQIAQAEQASSGAAVAFPY